MSWKTLFAAACLVAVAPLTQADDLVGQTEQAQQQAREHNQAREAEFAMTERELRAKLEQLKTTRHALEAETEKLSDTFSDNEQQLASLEEKLRLESGSLGELFGVVRQASKTLQTDGISSYVASLSQHLIRPCQILSRPIRCHRSSSLIPCGKAC